MNQRQRLILSTSEKKKSYSIYIKLRSKFSINSAIMDEIAGTNFEWAYQVKSISDFTDPAFNCIVSKFNVISARKVAAS